MGETALGGGKRGYLKRERRRNKKVRGGFKAQIKKGPPIEWRRLTRRKKYGRGG